MVAAPARGPSGSGSPSVCVVGAANVDLTTYVPRLPREGETLHGRDFQLGYGGKGANQAVMAAKLGARVSLVTKLGADAFGEGARENLRSLGVDTTHVLAAGDAATGVAAITVDQQGRNSIVIVMGANDLLTTDEVQAAGPAIAGAAVLVCQLEVPVEVSLVALRLARDAGVTTVLNPAPARADLPAEAYRLTDVLCPNEREAELLTGRSVGTLDEARRAVDVLRERGAGAVVLTLGGRGCLVATAAATTHLPAEQVQPVDSTGAGDAFVGSLAYLLAQGRDLVEAASRANRVAAVSVTRRGALSSFPWAADLPAGVLD
ncbi:MAG: ribokinase [Actinomycetota bacterium]